MNKQSAIAILIFVGMASSNIVNGQSYLENSKDGTFIEQQRQFELWSEGKDLDNTKGWKWYKRWEEHYSKRMNSNGELADPNIFLKAAIKTAHDKQTRKGDDVSNWLPYGPDYLPTSPNPVSGHGISRINCVAFHPTDENTFWIGASQGGIWKTSDAGENWTPLNDGLPILRISDLTIDPTDPDIMYACLGDFEYNAVSLEFDNRKRHTHFGLGVYKTTDGGISWQPTGLTVAQEDFDYSLLRRLVIDPNNPTHLVAGGLEGIWKTTDGGDNWTNVEDDLLICDVEQDPQNPNILFAASMYVSVLDDGSTGILRSTDFGDTWNWVQAGIPQFDVRRIELAIAPSNPDYIYAHCVNIYGGLYGIYRSTNGGDNWTLMTGQDTPNIMHWYEGNGNGGQGSYDLAFVVHPEDENTIYSGGVNAWGSTDGGATWDGISYWVNYYGVSIHADQHQFKFNPLNNKFYVCNDGGIMTTDDLLIGSWFDVDNEDDYQWPTQWQNLTSGMQLTSFYRLGLSANNPGYLIAGAQDNSTFYYNNDIWINIIGGDGMECLIHPNDPETLVGSSQYGSMSKSYNGGINIDYGIAGSILQEEDGEWTTPFQFHADSEVLYAGYGNLWKSNNLGDSWNKISDFDNIPQLGVPAPCSYFDVCETDNNAIYFAKRLWYSAGVESAMWVTFDEGDNWTDVSDGLPTGLFFTYVTVDDDNPQLAWVTCSGFEDGMKVFKTENGGTDWVNISYDLPNIPVNCVVLDEKSSNHTLYLGTDLGVYTIADGATEWEPFLQNLPNVIVGELEIDYESSEMYAATFGRGIWKTEIPSFVVDVPDVETAVSYSVGPNPTEDQIGISVDGLENVEWLDVRLVDIKGATVHQERHQVQSGALRSTYFLNAFSPGVYFMELKAGDWVAVEKIVRK
jgi:photosystem II stability/assembly factor-like uncharacterized protein